MIQAADKAILRFIAEQQRPLAASEITSALGLVRCCTWNCQRLRRLGLIDIEPISGSGYVITAAGREELDG